ncbi:hypothetical protein [Ancylobacter sp. TS-1]|uniref:hypothetical protein n=1 Tax=Ancylobacter sp. TS-1 TaxID=1850374 RepID=UPI001265C87B|nr:hypothetical protein [Ancylobacter sp. TS-1]QFR34851.1 hypothetical protein GBB76_18015 [Ancylobacter sp. TS-1]
MDGDELRKILCRLETGMVLTVPDEWIDRTIAGSNVTRARLVGEIARQFFCIHRQDFGAQRFEKQEVPFTG